ncbi:MAG TPA: helix-turn-helix domain-containing protein [Pyrinomonadaceae bacterium]|nr:helix-turn-helix domain-containing protein [Pyrinomonadaceae bacterium]
MNLDKKVLSGNHPSRRRRNPISDCPLTAALAAVGGKWKMIIIYWLAESPKHFAAIRKAMPGISQKVLTQQLKELADDDIVRRQPTGVAPAPVEYSLTDYGKSLLPVVESVRLWGRGHIEKFRSVESSNGNRQRA